MENLLDNIIQTSIPTYPTKEKVTVKPIRRPSDWLPSGHDSEFMNEGAGWVLCVPSHGNKKVLVDPLKDIALEYKQKLADDLGLESVSKFNVHRPDSFWKGFEIRLDRNGRVLDLQDPYDFVIYLALLCNTEYIAPSWVMRNMKQTYKYALEHAKDKVNTEIAEVNFKEKSYLTLSQMSNSRDLMNDYLWAHYLQVRTAKRPPIDASPDWLKKEIAKIIENDSKLFLKIAEDGDYRYKVMIVKALNVGAVHKDGEKYKFPGGEFPVGNLDQLVDHLKDERYQEDYLKLQTQIDIAQKKTLDNAKIDDKPTLDELKNETKKTEGESPIKLPGEITDVQHGPDATGPAEANVTDTTDETGPES